MGNIMKTTAKFSISTGCGALALLAATAMSLPAFGAEIIVYEDAYYSGASRQLTDDIEDLDVERFNNRISSVRVVSGFWTLCENRNFSGRCESVSGDVSNLASTGLNDRISSVRLDSRGDADRDGIVLFDSSEFRGREIELESDAPRLGEFDFNDRASSIRVLGGTWEVCRDGDYAGRCTEISEDVARLGELNLNNEISSIRLIRSEFDGWDNWWNGSRDDRWESWGEQEQSRAGVYENINYRGRGREFDSAVPDLRAENFNNRISSFRLEGRWQVCEDVNFGGECQIFRFDEPTLVPLSWNDRISSMRPVGRRAGDRPGLVLFEEAGFHGDRERIRDDEPDFNEIGFNDVASSLRVREGVWEICEDTGFRGRCRIVEANVRDLSDVGLNNRISSARRLDREDAGIGNGNGGPSIRDGITIFEHTGFEGNSRHISEDEPSLVPLGFNDVLSSIRIHDGRWEFCEHVNYAGRCWTFEADEPNVVPLGLNDRISSIRRRDGGGGGYSNSPTRGITIFENNNYQGQSESFNFDVPSLGTYGLNDDLSSFRVEEGTWELCEHANYSGRCWTVTRDEPSAAQYGFNDTISSLRRVDEYSNDGGYQDNGGYQDYDGGGSGRIEVFADTDYRGRSRIFSGTITNLANEGWNDEISSFRIEGSGRWEICDDSGFGGRCQLFSSDEPTLIPFNWNDRISSMRYLP